MRADRRLGFAARKAPVMSYSMDYDLERNDPAQQGGRRQSEQSPPDLYWEQVKHMEAVSAAWSARMRAKREAKKQRRDVG